MNEYTDARAHAINYCQPLQYRTPDCKVMLNLMLRANTVAFSPVDDADDMVAYTEVIDTLTKNLRSKLAIAQQRGKHGELYSLP